MINENFHQPVLLEETISYLLTDPGGIYVDCTVGGGGHSKTLFDRSKGRAKIIGLDKDSLVLEETKEKLADLGIKFFHSDFSNLQQVLHDNHIETVDGVLADLGVSSFQLDRPERGFSFYDEGPLDMRMNPQDSLTAQTLVNEASEAELKKIFYQYGEERFSPAIARAIVKARQTQAITTTGQLVAIIKKTLPAKYSYDKHPARRTFQALRCVVNNELNALEVMLPQALQLLRPGGRLVVIAFHSLEDRIVKNFMQAQAKECICPVRAPICTCNHKAQMKILTKKPIVPGEKECKDNPRARSAKLRVAMKL